MLMKLINLLLLISISCLAVNSNAQTCPNGDIEFASQEQVDSFIIVYPMCDMIDGDLTILNTDVTNLDGLSNINFISGNLRIEENNNLLSLEGLSNLDSVFGEVKIYKAPLLSNLNGLENLIYISAMIYLFHFNDTLENILGLENLIHVGGKLFIAANKEMTSLEGLGNLGFLGERLHIATLDKLTDLTGLESLTETGGLFIAGNPLLTDLSGLENISSITAGISIESNEILDNLTGLDGITKIHGELSIQSNPLLTSVEGLQNVDTIEQVFFYFNPSLISLNGLSSLNHVEDYVRFYFNHSLVNFEGLENLTTINGHLLLDHNSGLENFEGLENLHKIGSYFYVTGSTSLINFSGLQSLDTIGWYIWVNNNNSLMNFDGLNNLNSINGDLKITGNDTLENLSGLDNLNSSGVDDLIVTYNPNLSACSYGVICDYLINSNGSSTFANNALGCDDENDVIAQCVFPSRVNHPVFYDLNENGMLDLDEPFYPPGNITIEPNNLQVYSNEIDGGTTYLPWGDYIFSFEALNNPNWEPTTGPSSYNLQIDAANPTDTVYFGIAPINLIPDAGSVITAPDIRCNNWNNFDVIAENKGTTILNGILWLTWDENVDGVDYNTLPDTIILPNTVGWFFQDLYPGNTFKQEVRLFIPGPPEIPLGSSIINTSFVNYEDTNGTYESIPFHHRQLVLCSYDPNDKQVNPAYQDNYNLIGEDLIYTIRFQNTGNATAFDVVIRDTLDNNLAPNSFNLISSSHSSVLTTTMKDDQFLTFDFSDINLPDSTSNFDESQGYIIYRIRTLAGIAEGTIVNNSASIYFDNNPPIITNTTESIMLSTFDYDDDGVDFFSDCDDSNSEVYPGATEVAYNGLDDDCNVLTLDDDLDEDGYNLAEDCDDENPDVNPGVLEIVYNGLDDDCNELTLDDDLDQDGYNLAEDCDDENPDVNPGATEIVYNGLDDDCNVLTLDDDLDQDGYNLAEDCDDENPDVNPGVLEIVYNGLDDDCNELTLDDDLDQDGYNLAEDCDDENPDVNPGATEIVYNGLDDDCNVSTLDDDLDEDGYGILEDCDDENPDVNPGATELAYNGLDDDCNVLTLDDDLDEDGYGILEDCDDENASINPDAIEIANNGVDENCDGEDLIVSNQELHPKRFEIFPNPTKSWVQIKLPEEYSTAQICLKNLSSQTVLQKTIQKDDQIDLSDLANGVYLLKIQTGKYIWMEKIVKVRQ